MKRFSNRRLFVWSVLCCAFASLCGCCRACSWAILCWAIFICPLLLQLRRGIASKSHSLDSIALFLLLLFQPLGAFAYSFASTVPHHINSESQAQSISRFVNSRVLLRGVIIEDVAPEPESSTQKSCHHILIIDCQRIEFPISANVSGRLAVEFKPSAAPVSSSIPFEAIEQQIFYCGQTVMVPCYLRSAFSNNELAAKSSSIACCVIEPGDVSLVSAGSEKASATAFFDSCIENCRSKITQAHKSILGENMGALLTSIVLGQHAVLLPKNVIQNFRDVGLSHIVAASGFNVSIVILVTYSLLQPLNLPFRGAELITLLMLAFYVALAGVSPSILRAALMSAFILLGKLSQRSIPIFPAISAALLITWVQSPNVLSDVGLQLSYSATIGIISAAQPLADRINSRPQIFFRKCAESVAVTIVAELSVLPIQLYYFFSLGLTFLPANLFVVPLVAPITVFGFLTSLMSLLQSGDNFFDLGVQCVFATIDHGLSFPLTYISFITEFLASLTWAQMRLGQPSVTSIVLYYSTLLLTVFLLRKGYRRSIIFILSAFAVAILITKPASTFCKAIVAPEGVLIVSPTQRAQWLSDIEIDSLVGAHKVSFQKALNYNAVNSLKRVGSGDFVQIDSTRFVYISSITNDALQTIQPASPTCKTSVLVFKIADGNLSREASSKLFSDLQALLQSYQCDLVLLTCKDFRLQKISALSTPRSTEHLPKQPLPANLELQNISGMKSVMLSREQLQKLTSDDCSLLRAHRLCN